MRIRTHGQASGTWSTYWFEKNLQGDIVAIYSPIGIKLASFSYDAWGNFTQIIHNSNAEYIVQKTPFRYRGYYYDSDLGFYVTGTRCYDPTIGRFINADGYVSTGQGLLGNNMYAYCNNSPIMHVDHTGNFGIGIAALILLGAVVVIGLTSCTQKKTVETTNEVKHSITQGAESIEVTITVDDVPRSKEFLTEYTNLLADEIESDPQYAEFLDGHKIDREQLYSEIKFHVWCWDMKIKRKNANPANINIYADGSVVDPRPWLNTLVDIMFGGEYE